jgi:hypothetical protein
MRAESSSASTRSRGLWVVPSCIAVLVVCGCSSPRPVLSPTDAARRAGPELARESVDHCLARADRIVDDSQDDAALLMNLAVTAAVMAGGENTRGPGFSTCKGDLCVEKAYRRYVEACLDEQGYRTVTWR